MSSPTAPRKNKPKTFCPKCHSRGVVTVKLPDGSTMCLPCIRSHKPTVYLNIVMWVKNHEPTEEKPPTPGG